MADARVRRIRSLRLRFVLAIATLVALVLVANSLGRAPANRPPLREDLETAPQAYARLSTAQVCNARETSYASEYSKFREIVQDKMQLEPDLARLAIYDTGGRVLFDSREFGNELGEPVEPVDRGDRGADRGDRGQGAGRDDRVERVERVERRQAPAAGERLLAAVQGMAPRAWAARDGRAHL